MGALGRRRAQEWAQGGSLPPEGYRRLAVDMLEGVLENLRACPPDRERELLSMEAAAVEKVGAWRAPGALKAKGLWDGVQAARKARFDRTWLLDPARSEVWINAAGLDYEALLSGMRRLGLLLREAA